MKHLLHLIDTLENEEEIVIFLGAGASMDGLQDGKPFPSFDALIDKVLRRYGVSATDKVDRFNEFIAIVKRWEKEESLEDRFTGLMEGEPGAAHYYLATLILSAAESKGNLSLVLTTNFDSLIDLALSHIKPGALSKSLDKLRYGDAERRALGQLTKRARSGIPVVLKLFGDTTSIPPIFDQEDMSFDSSIVEVVEEWFRKPMVFIGYSFSDNLILEFLAGSGGKKPIFVVNPSEHLSDYMVRNKRVFHIRNKFNPFIQETVNILKHRESALVNKYDELICKIDPVNLYTSAESIEAKTRIASRHMIKTVDAKLVVGSEKIIPIMRAETNINWQSFLKSTSSCLALIGKSGSGKTTLLYNLARYENKDVIKLFYSIQQIESFQSLRERIAYDLSSDVKNLDRLLEHFGSILEKEGKYLLVIIDAINESKEQNISSQKIAFEELAGRLPSHIKMIYSCKESTWLNQDYRSSTLPLGIYFNNSVSYLSDSYSESETHLAFISYQRSYGLEADFSSLHEDVKLHLSNPFLMKMIASAYQGEKLPRGIQIEKVFETYHKRLLSHLKSPILGLCIDAIIDDQIDAFMTNGVFSGNYVSMPDLLKLEHVRDYIVIQQSDNVRAGNPFSILADEGLLISNASDAGAYSFFHDRYHEFMLSKGIARKASLDSLEIYTEFLKGCLSKIKNSDTAIYNAIVLFAARQSSVNTNYSFLNEEVFNSFRDLQNRALYFFSVDVIRTILNESVVPVDDLKNIKNKFDRFTLFDIFQGRPELESLIFIGMFSGHLATLRRCVQVINKSDSGLLEIISELITKHVKEKPKLDENDFTGLLYFSGCIVSSANTDESFIPLVKFWKNTLPNGIKLVEKPIFSQALTKLIDNELVHFIPSMHGDNSFDYLWGAQFSALKVDAIYLLGALVSDSPIEDERLLSILELFGSEFSEHQNPELEVSFFTHKIEYKLVKWLLVKKSRNSYEDVRSILDELVKKGFWTTTDFCLCTMKYILQQVHFDNEAVLRDGFETLKRWTEDFEKNDRKFFHSLTFEDPFKSHFNSLSQVSRIEAQFFRPKNGEISFLKKRLLSPDVSLVRLATLSLRQLWRDHCDGVLATLACVFEYDDELVSSWVDRTLSEIYLIHPSKVNFFLEQHSCQLDRSHRIRNSIDVKETSGVEYFGESFYSKVFLSTEKNLTSFAEIYSYLITKSTSKGDFSEYLVNLVNNNLAND